MSDMAPCLECGAGEQEPCTPECGCLHCVLKAIPIPTTVEGALHQANLAAFEGRAFEAQLLMMRVGHLAKGLP